MTLLLNDEMAPMTSEFGLIHAPCEVIAAWWVKWESAIQASRGVTLSLGNVEGSFRSLLGSLLPLTSVEHRRVLLIPTTSEWTAFFDNGRRGSDAARLAYVAQELACQAIRLVSVPSGDGRYGARMFELYGPKKMEFLNYVRTISAANDGGKWRFDQSGMPLPEEDSAWYSARSVKNRFTHEQLALLLRRLGLRPFEQDFYRSSGTLIERHGPTAPNLREFQLAEVQAEWKA